MMSLGFVARNLLQIFSPFVMMKMSQSLFRPGLIFGQGNFIEPKASPIDPSGDLSKTTKIPFCPRSIVSSPFGTQDGLVGQGLGASFWEILGFVGGYNLFALCYRPKGQSLFRPGLPSLLSEPKALPIDPSGDLSKTTKIPFCPGSIGLHPSALRTVL